MEGDERHAAHTAHNIASIMSIAWCTEKIRIPCTYSRGGAEISDLIDAVRDTADITHVAGTIMFGLFQYDTYPNNTINISNALIHLQWAQI